MTGLCEHGIARNHCDLCGQNITDEYDLWHEAQRIIDAIEPRAGAHMTLMTALHEAWQAGVDGRRPIWRFR